VTRDEYAADVCTRLDQAADIPFQPVAIGGWEPQRGKCHENVDFWVKANPGSIAVRGWVTGNRLTAHSVVQGVDGKLLDITPLCDERERLGMHFVRHVGDEQVFWAAKELSVFIDCPITAEELADIQA